MRKGDAETGAHREANKDDQLVLPRIVGSGLRRISCRSAAGVVCLAPGVLASSAGKLCGVFIVRGKALAQACVGCLPTEDVVGPGEGVKAGVAHARGEGP